MKRIAKKIVLSILYSVVFFYTPLVLYANSTKNQCPVAKQKKSSKNIPSKADKLQKQRIQLIPKRSLLPKKQFQDSGYGRDQFHELLRSSSKFGVGLFAIWGGNTLFGGDKLNFSMLMGPLVANLLAHPLQEIGSTLCGIFTPGLSKPALRKALALKKQYESRQTKVPTTMQYYLKNKIQQYLYWIQRLDYKDAPTEKAIEEILRFPVEPKEIEPCLAPIFSLLQAYPQAIRNAVANFVAGIITDSNYAALTKRRTPIMFVGPPGTGKTHLAKQLGNLLDLPTHVIDLSQYKNVYGQSVHAGDAQKGLWVDILLDHKDGLINPANKIIILDEVDKVLEKNAEGRFIHPNGPEIYAFLHKLLDGQELDTPLARYDNAAYSIAHVNIILIGNRDFSEALGKKEAAALESRVHLVQFDNGFEATEKLAIVNQYIRDCCLKRGIDCAKIDQTMIEKIIQADNQAGYKGVRVLLQVVDKYLQSIEQSALIAAISGVDASNFDIAQAYAQQHASSPNSKPAA